MLDRMANGPTPPPPGAASLVPPPPVAPVVEQPRFVKELDTLVRARYPLIYLVSWEEQRLDTILDELARRHGKALVAWSVTKGLRRVGGMRGGGPEGAREPMEALAAIEKLTEPSLVVLKDFHP
jgi:hypothetical protein